MKPKRVFFAFRILLNCFLKQDEEEEEQEEIEEFPDVDVDLAVILG